MSIHYIHFYLFISQSSCDQQWQEKGANVKLLALPEKDIILPFCQHLEEIKPIPKL